MEEKALELIIPTSLGDEVFALDLVIRLINY
jgi:hypothetical protein